MLHPSARLALALAWLATSGCPKIQGDPREHPAAAAPAAPSATATASDSARAPSGASTQTVDPGPAASRARGAIAEAVSAVQALAAAWEDEVLATAQGERLELAQSVSETVRALAGARAVRRDCRDDFQRVDSTLSQQERQLLVLAGAIAALDRAGSCWSVSVPASPFREVIAYFEAATGALLLVWYPPEG